MNAVTSCEVPTRSTRRIGPWTDLPKRGSAPTGTRCDPVPRGYGRSSRGVAIDVRAVRSGCAASPAGEAARAFSVLGGDLLYGPAVAVRVGEEEERAPGEPLDVADVH